VSITRLVVSAALVLWLASGCADSRQAEELELQRRELASLQEAQRVEAARIEAARIAAERVQREEQARLRRQMLASDFSRSAGRQIMDAIGGGQDLIVRHGEFNYDAARGELEIPMDVSFNGLFIRRNNYRVNGVLTVGEDGGNPRFARLEANQNYLDMEETITALAFTAAGVMVLSEMSDTAKR
jgi:hypothetical protein